MAIRQNEAKPVDSDSLVAENAVSVQPSGISLNSYELNCPVCGYSIVAGVNGKRKLRTRVLVFNENGNTMGICPKCKTNLRIPVVFANKDHAIHGGNGTESSERLVGRRDVGEKLRRAKENQA